MKPKNNYSKKFTVSKLTNPKPSYSIKINLTIQENIPLIVLDSDSDDSDDSDDSVILLDSDSDDSVILLDSDSDDTDAKYILPEDLVPEDEDEDEDDSPEVEDDESLYHHLPDDVIPKSPDGNFNNTIFYN